MKKNSPIKGLIIYTFYSASGNTSIVLAVCLLIGIIMTVTGIPTGLSASVFFWITFLSCTLMISAHKDSASKWNRFQLAMPVKRSDVIASKYLGHLILLLVGIVLAGIFIGLSAAIHENLLNNVLDAVLTVVPACIGTSLLSCSLFYPIIYSIGENKEEALSLVCISSALAINVFVLWVGNMVKFSQYINAVFCIAVATVLFVVSYAITTKIYANKDL